MRESIAHEVKDKVSLDPVRYEESVERDQEPGVPLTQSLLIFSVVLGILRSVEVDEGEDYVDQEKVRKTRSERIESPRMQQDQETRSCISCELNPVKLKHHPALSLPCHSIL